MTAQNDDESHQMSRATFPYQLSMIGMMGDSGPLNASSSRIIRPSQLNFFNRSLNQEQMAAVVSIVQSIGWPAPYLIYGPPGKCI
jgi:hypothetical protein